MGAGSTDARLISRTRAAGVGVRALIGPSTDGRTVPVERLIARVEAAGVDAIALVEPTEQLLDALEAQVDLPIEVVGRDQLGGGGPISLCPDGDPWLLGPGPAAVRRIETDDALPDAPDQRARLRLIDLCLGGRGKPPSDRLDPMDHPPLSLCVAASRRINRHCLKFLVHAGGLTLRTVLRDGRRVRGRIWDRRLKEGFVLRFGIATTRLWTHWSVAALMHPQAKVRRRRMRHWLPATDTDTGDWIVFARLYAHLSHLALRPEARALVAQRCLQLSPLAQLASLELDRREADGGLALLIAPHAVRIVECVDGWLETRWRLALRDLRRSTVAVARVEAAGRLIQRWYAILDAGQRTDLARALMRVTGEWLIETDANQLRASVARRADRQAIRAAFSALVDAMSVPEAIRAAFIEERYGDPRYAESQLFVADYDALFAEAATLIPHFQRTMRGVIG